MPVVKTPVPSIENRPPGEAELDEAEQGMEDKLYCICETKYDDERVMIACDRYAAPMFELRSAHILSSCDEWYHTSCVNMPDLQLDLVDQFICPLCVESACSRQLPFALVLSEYDVQRTLTSICARPGNAVA